MNRRARMATIWARAVLAVKIPSAHRPRYTPWQRLRILWHKVRYGLSLRATARIFVVEPSTLTRWVRAAEEGGRSLLRAIGPVNRLSDLAGELARLLRFEQPHWGTRRIAQVLARLGIEISRSSVQRRLRRKPRPPVAPVAVPVKDRRGGIRARAPHHVWLMDFTTVKALFGLIEIRVGAVLDAFSRSVIATGACSKEPSAAWTCRLLRRGIRAAGTRPRYVVTDQGSQFTSKHFRRCLKSGKIRHRYGAVGSSGSIALLERFWLSLKTELADALFLWFTPRLAESSLRAWTSWYQRYRPHQGRGGLTPDEMLRGRARRRLLRVEPDVRWHLEREHLASERALPIYRLRRAA